MEVEDNKGIDYTDGQYGRPSDISLPDLPIRRDGFQSTRSKEQAAGCNKELSPPYLSDGMDSSQS
jgi:hypothetical protein